MVGKVCFSDAKYLIGAAEIKGLPKNSGGEVAFIGRSNAGKSSALNTITGIKGLARTSSTPGRTQMMHFFDLGHDCRLVDLPGYGYAKVPKPIKEKWQRVTNEYLETRGCLQGLVLVMDIRHPLKEQDWNIIAWTAEWDLPCHILLTKADKLKPNKARMALQQTVAQLERFDLVSVDVFSSQNKLGLAEARSVIDDWFDLDDEEDGDV
jgi:GTP-binding protein